MFNSRHNKILDLAGLVVIRRASLWRPAIIIGLPLLVFHWMVPFLSKWIIGNDYLAIPILHQLDLMFALKTGTFPIYIPGFAGGHSASALTLGQLFHPISHIASILPGYWEGQALEWNTLLRLFSLGLAQLVLFDFLRRLKLSIFAAFIISFITAYNLRMLDLFRYGASLESWTGHLFLCAAMGGYYVQPTKIKGPLFIIIATYWLVCSGHPQMMYYGILGAGLFALATPYFVRMLLPERTADIREVLKFWLQSFSFCGIGVLLSAAYILPFYFDFLAWNTARVAQDYLWADMYRDTLTGTLNNFFYPLRSDVTGVFGGSSLILVVALVPLLRFFRVKLPAVIWASWALLVLAFLYMQGARTPVHYIFWKILPFASSFRGAGRISMIMPVFFMMILAWLMADGSLKRRIDISGIKFQFHSILSLIALMIIVGYFCFADLLVSDTSVYSAAVIRNIPFWIEPFALVLGMAALTGLMFYGFFNRRQNWITSLICVFICIQVMINLQYGTWVERVDTVKKTPTLSQIQAQKKSTLNFQYSAGYGLVNSVVANHVAHTFLEPHIGRIYTKYRTVNNKETAYALMQTSRSPDQVTIERYAPGHSPPPTHNDSEHKSSRVELVYSSYNRLVFYAQTFQNGFLGLSYPYTGHWNGFVNNNPVKVYRANGAEHVVEIPRGISQVEFRYWSPAVIWGMGISCTTLIMAGFIFSRRAFSKGKKWLLAASVFLVMGLGVFFLWYRSLYNGDNLGTLYAWQTRPISTPANLAYGKKTKMSSLLYPDFPYYKSSAKAVDGSRVPASGFLTASDISPWWAIDLHQTLDFNQIIIFEAQQDTNINARPLKVTFSDDGHNWRPGAVISEVSRNGRLNLVFEEPQKARYVLIRSSGTCHLSFDEVEIFLAQEKTS